jgi:hypothetical protein
MGVVVLVVIPRRRRRRGVVLWRGVVRIRRLVLMMMMQGMRRRYVRVAIIAHFRTLGRAHHHGASVVYRVLSAPGGGLRRRG